MIKELLNDQLRAQFKAYIPFLVGFPGSGRLLVQLALDVACPVRDERHTTRRMRFLIFGVPLRRVLNWLMC